MRLSPKILAFVTSTFVVLVSAAASLLPNKYEGMRENLFWMTLAGIVIILGTFSFVFSSQYFFRRVSSFWRSRVIDRFKSVTDVFEKERILYSDETIDEKTLRALFQRCRKSLREEITYLIRLEKVNQSIKSQDTGFEEEVKEAKNTIQQVASLIDLEEQDFIDCYKNPKARSRRIKKLARNIRGIFYSCSSIS